MKLLLPKQRLYRLQPHTLSLQHCTRLPDVCLNCYDCLQAALSELAVFLGEKKDSDPAAVFTLLYNFTKAFDATLVQVAKRHSRDISVGEPSV